MAFYFRRVGPASQRKNTMMSAAGMNGPHQWSSPNAISVVDPAFTNSMMDPAQASALSKFNAENFVARTPA